MTSAHPRQTHPHGAPGRPGHPSAYPGRARERASRAAPWGWPPAPWSRTASQPSRIGWHPGLGLSW